MKSRLVPVNCRACGYATILKKETYAVASFDDRLKKQLYDGTYFQFQCPHCHSWTTYAHPMLYYDGRKRFVLLLNEQEQETNFQPDLFCVQVHNSDDFVEHLHILEDDFLPSQIQRIKQQLEHRYPKAQIRYDSYENDVLWFIRKENQSETMIGVEKHKLSFSIDRKQ